MQVGQKLRSQNGKAGREQQVVDPEGWSDWGQVERGKEGDGFRGHHEMRDEGMGLLWA